MGGHGPRFDKAERWQPSSEFARALAATDLQRSFTMEGDAAEWHKTAVSIPRAARPISPALEGVASAHAELDHVPWGETATTGASGELDADADASALQGGWSMSDPGGLAAYREAYREQVEAVKRAASPSASFLAPGHGTILDELPTHQVRCEPPSCEIRTAYIRKGGFVCTHTPSIRMGWSCLQLGACTRAMHIGCSWPRPQVLAVGACG